MSNVNPQHNPADFTPTMAGYSQQSPFRFFCQSVLPLVYDDTLSYYELLCKVVDYLNHVIADVGTSETNIENLKNAYAELEQYVNEYFENLDVQEAINNKLDAMCEGGTESEFYELFGDLIQETAVDTVSSWINENITHSGEGYLLDDSFVSKKAPASAYHQELYCMNISNQGYTKVCTMRDTSVYTDFLDLSPTKNYYIRDYALHGNPSDETITNRPLKNFSLAASTGWSKSDLQYIMFHPIPTTPPYTDDFSDENATTMGTYAVYKNNTVPLVGYAESTNATGNKKLLLYGKFVAHSHTEDDTVIYDERYAEFSNVVATDGDLKDVEAVVNDCINVYGTTRLNSANTGVTNNTVAKLSPLKNYVIYNTSTQPVLSSNFSDFVIPQEFGFNKDDINFVYLYASTPIKYDTYNDVTFEFPVNVAISFKATSAHVEFRNKRLLFRAWWSMRNTSTEPITDGKLELFEQISCGVNNNNDNAPMSTGNVKAYVPTIAHNSQSTSRINSDNEGQITYTVAGLSPIQNYIIYNTTDKPILSNSFSDFLIDNTLGFSKSDIAFLYIYASAPINWETYNVANLEFPVLLAITFKTESTVPSKFRNKKLIYRAWWNITNKNLTVFERISNDFSEVYNSVGLTYLRKTGSFDDTVQYPSFSSLSPYKNYLISDVVFTYYRNIANDVVFESSFGLDVSNITSIGCYVVGCSVTNHMSNTYRTLSAQTYGELNIYTPVLVYLIGGIGIGLDQQGIMCKAYYNGLAGDKKLHICERISPLNSLNIDNAPPTSLAVKNALSALSNRINKQPKKIVYIGNSLLLGLFNDYNRPAAYADQSSTLGMCVTDYTKDYYYAVQNAFNLPTTFNYGAYNSSSQSTDYISHLNNTALKVRGVESIEDQTNTAEALAWINNTLINKWINNSTYSYQDADLYIIQLGDNVGTTEERAAFPTNFTNMVTAIRQNAEQIGCNPKIVFIGSWYNSQHHGTNNRQMYVNMCTANNVEFIDITNVEHTLTNMPTMGMKFYLRQDGAREYKTGDGVSALSYVVNENNTITFTYSYNFTSGGHTYTGTNETVTIPYTSYTPDSTNPDSDVTVVGKEHFVYNRVMISHPSDNGFSAIINIILNRLSEIYS